MRPMPCWSVVVPVKRVPLAKSRLVGLPGPLRADLVVAMAADTVAAAVRCRLVAAVYVVTDDPRAARALTAGGANLVADEPDAGLNPAIAHGAAVAARARPDCGVAALAADLPALAATELEVALAAAGRHPRALVADHGGLGTTLLTAAPGVALAPAYGVSSKQRHLESGVVELALADCPGLRRDVDTLQDLAAAEVLGLGPFTSAVRRNAHPTTT